MTCANTETEIPVLQIVNEILERDIATRSGFAGDPGDEAAISQLVYGDVLAAAEDSFAQPFNLALERLRTYLVHSGHTRGEIAALVGAGGDVRAAAALGLSARERAVITTPDADLDALSALYGIAFTLVPGGDFVTPFDAQELDKDLAAILEKAGGEPHLVEVATRIAPQMRATKKFVDFLLAFAATAPMPRPVIGPLDWSRAAMERHFRAIYKARSKDLHEGIPFPLPMCRAPLRVHGEGGFSEVPYGHGHARWSGPLQWAYGDIPMLLNTFKYIVDHALRAWWQTMP